MVAFLLGEGSFVGLILLSDCVGYCISIAEAVDSVESSSSLNSCWLCYRN